MPGIIEIIKTTTIIASRKISSLTNKKVKLTVAIQTNAVDTKFKMPIFICRLAVIILVIVSRYMPNIK